MATEPVDSEPPAWKHELSVVLALLTLYLLVVARILLTPYIGDDVQFATYVCIVGGLVGAAGMALTRWAAGMVWARPVTETWMRLIGTADYDTALPMGKYCYVTAAGVLGGLYSRVGWLAVQETTGLWPGGVVTGMGYGLTLGIVGLVAGLLGLWDVEVTARETGVYVGSFLVFGLLLGLVRVGTT